MKRTREITFQQLIDDSFPNLNAAMLKANLMLAGATLIGVIALLFS